MFFWCFWGSQVIVWELDQQNGMSWESLEGFLFIWRWSVSIKDIVPMVVRCPPGTLARSSRATGERARELRKGDREIYKRLCHQPQTAKHCRGISIFLSLRLYRVLWAARCVNSIFFSAVHVCLRDLCLGWVVRYKHHKFQPPILKRNITKQPTSRSLYN